jgi:glycosyltransferase involved in cell wall biosynthesis
LDSLRILVITNHFHPENFRINDLALGLRERGHDITVFTGVPDYPDGKIYKGYGVFRRRREIWEGIKVVRFPLIPRGKGRGIDLALNYLSSAFFSTFLAPLCCRERYDLIFVFESSPITIGLPAIILRKLRKIPVFFWVLDLWPESLSATGAIRSPFLLGQVRKLVRCIYRNCDRLLISSRGFEKSIKETGGYEDRIEYFPNWVEPEYFASPVLSRGASLPKLPAGFRVLFAGNIGAAQDFPTILGAAERLKDYPDIQWVILGDGRRADWLLDQVKVRKLEKSFHLLGKYPPDTMPGFFAQADALLVTLKKDPIFALTVPGKVQSYMACGRPVIAGMDGEGSQVIEEAGAGLTCPAESPDALADRVLSLYKMSIEDRQAMAERGRQYSLKHFNREILFSRLEDQMRSTIQSKKKACAKEVCNENS